MKKILIFAMYMAIGFTIACDNADRYDPAAANDSPPPEKGDRQAQNRKSLDLKNDNDGNDGLSGDDPEAANDSPPPEEGDRQAQNRKSLDLKNDNDGLSGYDPAAANDSPPPEKGDRQAQNRKSLDLKNDNDGNDGLSGDDPEAANDSPPPEEGDRQAQNRKSLDLKNDNDGLSGYDPAAANDSPLLQDVRKSIFMIKINNDAKGTGFVVEGDTLVTNLHVYDDVIGRGGLNSLRIENINSEKFYIEGVRGINFPADLVLLKIKDYEGPSLDIESPIEARLSEHRSHQLFLAGFPHGIFLITALTKDKSYTDGITQEFFKNNFMENRLGASGSPIVNEKGKVVAVYKASNPSKDYGTRKEILQDLLNKTRQQEIVSDNEAIYDWIQQEHRNLHILANKGNVTALFQLGEILFYELVTKHTSFYERTRQSEFFWRKAAYRGHVRAQYLMGRIFFDRAVNIKQAIMWLKEAALQQAIMWLKEAALQNYVEAQYWLGRVLYNERIDLEQAKIWIKRAAEKGHIEAQFKLGTILLNERHLEQAVIWLTQAANNNYIQAQYLMGRLSFNEGDIRQGVIWLIQASDNGHFRAQNELVNHCRKTKKCQNMATQID